MASGDSTVKRVGTFAVWGAVLLATSVGVPVKADIINDLAFGDAAYALDFLGFDLIGQENPLTGGIDFLTTQNFANQTVDLGRSELTLNGPLSFEFHTGNRLLHTVDISFGTSINAQGQAQPLTYAYTQRLGLQDTTVEGSLLLDGDLSVDQLGFYDLSLRYSTRNDYNSDGPYGPQSDTFDADAGPINVSGNIFVDLAAVVLDPFFERSGRENPLTPLSGIKQTQDRLASAMEFQAQALTGATDAGSTSSRVALTPSPSTLILLGAVVPWVIFRRRRQR